MVWINLYKDQDSQLKLLRYVTLTNRECSFTSGDVWSCDGDKGESI